MIQINPEAAIRPQPVGTGRVRSLHERLGQLRTKLKNRDAVLATAATAASDNGQIWDHSGSPPGSLVTSPTQTGQRPPTSVIIPAPGDVAKVLRARASPDVYSGVQMKNDAAIMMVSELLLKRYRRELEAIYAANNPKLLPMIEELLERNCFDLHGLYVRVCKKYSVRPKYMGIMGKAVAGKMIKPSMFKKGKKNKSNQGRAANTVEEVLVFNYGQFSPLLVQDFKAQRAICHGFVKIFQTIPDGHSMVNLVPQTSEDNVSPGLAYRIPKNDLDKFVSRVEHYWYKPRTVKIDIPGEGTQTAVTFVHKESRKGPIEFAPPRKGHIRQVAEVLLACEGPGGMRRASMVGSKSQHDAGNPEDAGDVTVVIRRPDESVYGSYDTKTDKIAAGLGGTVDDADKLLELLGGTNDDPALLLDKRDKKKSGKPEPIRVPADEERPSIGSISANSPNMPSPGSFDKDFNFSDLPEAPVIKSTGNIFAEEDDEMIDAVMQTLNTIRKMTSAIKDSTFGLEGDVIDQEMAALRAFSINDLGVFLDEE